MSFFAELRRRNVFRVGIAYAVTAWILLQLTEVLTELLELSTDIGKMVIVLLLIGFIPALIFAWAFELTPEGIKRESEVDRATSITPQTGRKLDRAIIVVLAVALAWFAWDKFGAPIAESGPEAPALVEDTAQEDEAPAASTGASIAVLPFVNMSADADNEYFSDGLSEELGNLLAGVDGLKVAARTSSFKFKDTDADIAEIGERLNVETVLEGSVRRAGDQVRITAQLVKVDDGFRLWSETYDRQLDNIFVVQDEIAGAIVEALRLPLLGEAQPRVEAQQTASFEAFDLYLAGRHHARTLTGEGFTKAIDLFTQAVALDPTYVPAWSALAEAYLGTVAWGDSRLLDVLDEAEAAADRALALDPDAADALLAKSMVLINLGQNVEARALDDRALEADPKHPEALRRASNWIRTTEPERSLALAEQALDIDPLSDLMRNTVINAVREARGLDAARARYETFLALDPENAVLIEQWAREEFDAWQLDRAILGFEKVWVLRDDAYAGAQLTRLYLQLDDIAQAEAWAEQVRNRSPDSQWAQGVDEMLAFYRGDYETLASILRVRKETREGDTPRYFSNLGDVMMVMGRNEEAEAAYRRSLELLQVDEAADPTGSETRTLRFLAYLLPEGPERSALIDRARKRYEAIKAGNPDDVTLGFFEAQLATLEGDSDAYFDAMDRVIDAGYRGARWLELSIGYFEWEDDPRFGEIMARLNRLAAEQLAALDAARAAAADADGAST